MKEITEALAIRREQIRTLQRDVDALQKAAGILGGGTATSTATAKKRSKAKVERKAKTRAAKPAAAPKRRGMDATARKAVSKRMKAYWAKRRKAKQ